MMNYRGTRVLVTGASAGLGVEFASRFAERGADLVLVARREDRLRELADRLSSEHGVDAVPIPFDLGQPDAAGKLRTTLDERGLRVHSLINNAGFGSKGPFAESDPDRMREMVTVNITTLVGLTRELLPDLTGVLVNMASIAAYLPCPEMAVYGATKAFVLNFTEAIAYETRHTGLRVLAVSPGPTRTEFFDVVGSNDAAVGGFETPAQVVGRAMRELDRARPRPSFVSGRMNALNTRIARLAPRRVTLAISGRALKA